MPILAYSPLLYLVDSYVGIYKIYTLHNPFTNEIFYVGQTTQELEARLIGHLRESESNKQKCDYIQEIIKQGGKPVIQAVETIKGTCYLDKMALNDRERYWIRYYKSIGCTLLNIAAISGSEKTPDYNNYLSSIKSGEAKWHYYYCGKTINGIDVYDEKRLNDDGFSLPKEQSPPAYIPPIPDDYNPWTNPRFIEKVGFRESYDNHYRYIPCYKDTDPNFYDDDY